MSMLNYLIKCNMENKINKARHFRLVYKDNYLSAVHSKTDTEFFINDIGDLYDLIESKYYITNMSLLDKYTSIANKYTLTYSYWSTIKSYLTYIYLDSFSIKRVDNLENTVSKLVLMGYSIVLRTTFYVLLMDSSSKNFILLSELKLAIGNETKFNFDNTYIKYINIENITNSGSLTNMDYWFSDCTCTKKVRIVNFDTKQITSMQGLFSGCTSLIDIDIETLCLENVYDMSEMFHNCDKLDNNVKKKILNQ